MITIRIRKRDILRVALMIAFLGICITLSYQAAADLLGENLVWRGVLMFGIGMYAGFVGRAMWHGTRQHTEQVVEGEE